MSLDMEDKNGNWVQLWNERDVTAATANVNYEGFSLTRVDIGEYPQWTLCIEISTDYYLSFITRHALDPTNIKLRLAFRDAEDDVIQAG